MSWPSTDFELEIQAELDTLRADNESLRGLLRAARTAAVRGDLHAVIVLTEPTGVLATTSAKDKP